MVGGKRKDSSFASSSSSSGARLLLLLPLLLLSRVSKMEKSRRLGLFFSLHFFGTEGTAANKKGDERGRRLPWGRLE